MLTRWQSAPSPATHATSGRAQRLPIRAVAVADMLRGLAIIALPLALAVLLSAFGARSDEPVRGVVRPVEEAWISTQLNAQILRIPKREGDAFEKGDVLVAFDCREYTAQLAAARAEQQHSKVMLDMSVEAAHGNGSGQLEVARNRVTLKKAVSKVDAFAARVRECTILAPFNGRVAELNAHAFELSMPGRPMLRIINPDALEIQLTVPSTWLQWLEPGKPFDVKIEETGTTLVARMDHAGAAVDPVGQTVKLTAVFAGHTREVLPGMSLTAQLRPPPGLR